MFGSMANRSKESSGFAQGIKRVSAFTGRPEEIPYMTPTFLWD